MPPRPVLKTRQGRPVSAVYIGKASSPNLQDFTHSAQFSSAYPSLIDGTPPGLPDLPEPPSPVSSVGSVKSGLPSPPATNSTGSGSTGDPATIALRERPLSLHSNSSASTSSGSHHTVSTPMKRSSNVTTSRSSSRLGNQDDTGAEGDFDDDYDKENDNDNESNQDGDDTARLDRKLLSNSNHDDKPKSSSENVLALQRVRSLAQRNRLALDKLARLGSPSPARPNTPNSRSPAPLHAPTTSSRLSQPPRQVRALPEPPQDYGRSGSETERESTTQHTNTQSQSSHSSSSHSYTSSPRHQSATLSSSNRSVTPPPTTYNNSPASRHRHLSAPDSPNKARRVAAGSTSTSSSSNSRSNSSRSPSNRRRHRSMASMSQLQLADFEEEEDVHDDANLKTATGTRGHTRDRTLNERDLITQSALAAVASSRRSPLGNRRRGALPKEFRSDLVNDSPSPNPASRPGSSAAYDSRDKMAQDERRESWKRSAEPITPLRPTPNGVGRSSTLRDTRRSGGPSPRWSSDDFRSPASLRDRHPNATQSTEDLIAQKERRQSLRGGSAESALLLWSPGGRSLLGEGLRAAGLSRRKEEDSRGRLTDAGPSTASGDSFRDRDRRVEWSPQDVLDEGRRRVFTQREKDRQDRQPQRASTSMAQYQYLDRDEDGRRGREGGRDLALRGHKSSYSLTTRERDASPTRRTGDPSAPRRERDSLPPERAGSSMSRFHNIQVPQHTSSPAPAMPAHLLERAATGSPFGTRRFTQSASSSTAQMQTEHTRLMIESLAMFEAQLAKLPPQLGSSTTSSSGVSSSHAELARNAQGVVYTAERLAALLKLSTARAQDAQVEAEVDTTERDRSQDILTIWNRVAADYRDGSRAADELVRGLTAVLLGVGRIMRDLGATAGTSEFGSPSVHGRHVSLSEEDIRGVSPDIRAESSASGRRSAASRHSWEPAPRDREREREEALRRLDGAPRSESVLARASPATFQKLRDREQLETPSHPSQSSLRKSTPGTGDRPASSVRRLFAPREQREQMFDAKVAPDNNDERRGPGMTTLDSQETIHGQGYEPSPTPASKTRASAASDRKRTLTPISIPKPLPILPSESLVRRQAGTSTAANNKANEGSLRDKVRQKSTIRSERPSFPSITTPSNATTALTPHTVSTTPSKTAGFPLVRTDSEKSTRSQVTFSRPVAVSVSATLSGIQQQHLDGERNRTISNASSNAEPSSSVRPDPIMRAMSGSETERDIRRKTVGTKTPRASLDSQLDERSTLTASGTRLSNVHAADRSAASTILHQSANAKRERRRTVTDIWPPE